MRLQPATSALPKNKVIASTLGSAIATIALSALRSRGIEIDTEMQGAITMLLTFGLGYLVPDRR